MAERHGRRANRRRPWGRPGSATPVLAAWATFVIVFVFLAVQMRDGKDPVLGAAAKPIERPVIVRRIERRVIITRLVREPAAPSVPSAASAPVTIAAPVTPSAPAPAPAPAAPAPVTTRSS